MPAAVAVALHCFPITNTSMSAVIIVNVVADAGVVAVAAADAGAVVADAGVDVAVAVAAVNGAIATKNAVIVNGCCRWLFIFSLLIVCFNR